jgi:undecaprenyl-diphosphatase
MDFQLQQWINGAAGANVVLDAVMVALAQWSEPAFIALVAGWLMFGVVRRLQVERVGAALALLAAGLAFAVNQVIAQFWARPRPFSSHPGSVHVLLGHSADASFPSDHVAAAVAISMMLLAIHRRLGIAALLLSVLVGYARVFVGDHYPGDVIGGVIVGGASAAMVGAVRLPELLSRADTAVAARLRPAAQAGPEPPGVPPQR